MTDNDILDIIIICSIFFGIAYPIIVKKITKRKEDKMNPNDFTIRQPKVILIIYTISTAYFSFATYLTAFPLFYILSLLGLALIISTHRWKITVKENQITYTPYIGETKSFLISEITKAECGTKRSRYGDIKYIKAYRNGEKLFYLTGKCSGFNVLFSRLEEEGVHIIDKRPVDEILNR